MSKEIKEKPFITGGHLRAPSHGAGCECCMPPEDELEEDESAGSERGNVLWFIMIGVALLAAITLVISRGSSSVDQAGDYEQNSVKASQILRYAKGLEAAVERLRMINGCSENDISFENATVSGYTNANSPADNSCHVFERDGGGESYIPPRTAYLDSSESAQDNYGDYWFTGTNLIQGVGTDAGNSTSSVSRELVMYLNWVDEDLCVALNRIVGLPMVADAPPVASGTRWDGVNQKWVGIFGPEYGYNISTTAGTGYTSGCWEGDTTPAGGFHFYHVLIAR